MIIIQHKSEEKPVKKYKCDCKCGCKFIFKENELISIAHLTSNYDDVRLIKCPECGTIFKVFPSCVSNINYISNEDYICLSQSANEEDKINE